MTVNELKKLGVETAGSYVEDWVAIVPEGMATEEVASGFAVAFLEHIPERNGTREVFLAGCLAAAIVRLAEERRKNCT